MSYRLAKLERRGISNSFHGWVNKSLHFELCYHIGRKQYMAEIENSIGLRHILFSRNLPNIIKQLNDSLKVYDADCHTILLTPEQHDNMISEFEKNIDKACEVINY